MSYYLLNIIYKGVLKMKKCDLTENKVKYISLLTETSDKLPILDPYIAIQVLCDYLLGTVITTFMTQLELIKQS